MSDVTLDVNMKHLTVEVRLLIETSQTGKGGIVEKRARPRKLHAVRSLTNY